MKKHFKLLSILLLIIFFISVLCSCDLSIGNGKSAYELAVENGYTGTLGEWLDSLKGKDGTDGKDGAYAGKGDSAYEIAVKEGFEGTEQDWLDSLKGDKGAAGESSLTNSVNKSILSCVIVLSSDNSAFQGTVGAGSGIILIDNKENGEAYIVTNYHVVYNSNQQKLFNYFKVYLYGMIYSASSGISATCIGGSMENDIAVLKISDSDYYKNSSCYPVTLGDSNKIYAGDDAIAIGNPEGNGFSVTTGHISVDSEYIDITAADNQTTLNLRVIRTDCAINGGNSGGGLFDYEGKLIGIVNAKIVSENIENIGYAIPVNVAYGVAQAIIDSYSSSNQYVTPIFPMLGITTQLKDSKAVYNSENSKTEIIQTIEVIEVSSTGSAFGKLFAGDILVSIICNGRTYDINRQFIVKDCLYYFKSGDKVHMTVLRSGIEMPVEITLQ